MKGSWSCGWMMLLIWSFSNIRLEQASAAFATATSSSPIPPPPPISMPVWSLACPATTYKTGDDNEAAACLSIMTFCTPVSVQPKLWALALYHGTHTKDSFLEGDCHGILQLLRRPVQANLVPILGKQSGYQVDKEHLCREAGHDWVKTHDTEDKLNHHIIPNCALYVQVGPTSNNSLEKGVDLSLIHI